MSPRDPAALPGISFSRAGPPLLIPEDSGWGPPSGPLKNGSLNGAAQLDAEGPDQPWK